MPIAAKACALLYSEYNLSNSIAENISRKASVKTVPSIRDTASLLPAKIKIIVNITLPTKNQTTPFKIPCLTF